MYMIVCERVCNDQVGSLIECTDCVSYSGLSVYLAYAGRSKKEPHYAHLFDPGSDAMSHPQLSGCALIGAQNLANLPV